MKQIFNKLIILIFFISTSCGGTWDNVKRGLAGGKKASSEEFLVKKKDPLVLPPRFDELPEPGRSGFKGEEEEALDIEDLLRLKDDEIDSIEIKSDGNLEESVLRKIRQNNAN